MKLRIAIAAAVVAGFSACKQEIPVSELAARVDGEPVMKTDFEQAVDRNLARYESAGHTLDPRVKDRIRESVLRRLIEHKIMELQAKKLKIELTPADVDARFEEHKGRWRSAQQFEDYLKRSQNTVENMKSDLAQNMLRDRVVQELSGEVKVTDDDVKKYYDEHPERFVNKERVRVSRIFKRVAASATDDEKKKIRAEADTIAVAAKKDGANFADLARKHSDGGEGKKGGELSWLVRGRMAPEFDQAAFTMEPGAVSGVVQTSAGFEVIKVWEKQPESRRGLDDVGKTIRSSLEARERNKRRREVLANLQKEAKVEQFIEFASAKPQVQKPKTPPPAPKVP
ncbi:MAG: peptidylprolyl isomerase [Myxococcota bacterium]